MITLAVINDIKDIEPILKRAIKCEGGILEVLYIHEESLFELPDLFKPKYLEDEQINKEEVKKKIKETLKSLNYTKDVAIFVYYNDTYSHVEHYLVDKEYLIITAYNEATKELYEDFKPICYLKNEYKEYRDILLAVALDGEDLDRINLIKKYFPNSNLTLLYDYIHMNIIPTIPEFYGDFTSYTLINIEIDEEIRKVKKEQFEELLNSTNLKGEFLEDISTYESLFIYLNNTKSDLIVLTSPYSEVVKDIKIDTFIIK